jgi:hypothetical protein
MRRLGSLARYLLLSIVRGGMRKLVYIAVVLIAVASLALQETQAHLLLNRHLTLSSPIGGPACNRGQMTITDVKMCKVIREPTPRPNLI